MQDEYTGLAGTYIIDVEKGIRMPLEQYEAEQAAKSQPIAQPIKQPLKEVTNGLIN